MRLIKRYITPIICLLSFLLIYVSYSTGILMGIDTKVDVLSRQINISLVHSIFKVITAFGSAKIIIGISLLVLFICFNRINNYKTISLLVTSSLGCFLLNSVIKNIVERPRPPLPHHVIETTYSFPSGHSMVGMCFYAVVAYLLSYIFVEHKKLIKVSLFTLAILIAISRVVLNVHYISDITAGFILGYGLYRALLIFYSKIDIKNKIRSVN